MWKNCEANFEGGKKEVIDHPEKYGLQKEQKPAWSEEDERIVGRIQMLLEFFDRNYPADMNIGSEIPKYISWLKSLRPSWKPSDEQMDALERASTNKYLSAKQFDILVSLHEQLKKL